MFFVALGVLVLAAGFFFSVRYNSDMNTVGAAILPAGVLLIAIGLVVTIVTNMFGSGDANPKDWEKPASDLRHQEMATTKFKESTYTFMDGTDWLHMTPEEKTQVITKICGRPPRLYNRPVVTNEIVNGWTAYFDHFYQKRKNLYKQFYEEMKFQDEAPPPHRWYQIFSSEE